MKQKYDNYNFNNINSIKKLPEILMVFRQLLEVYVEAGASTSFGGNRLLFHETCVFKINSAFADCVK